MLPSAYKIPAQTARGDYATLRFTLLRGTKFTDEHKVGMPRLGGTVPEFTCEDSYHGDIDLERRGIQ